MRPCLMLLGAQSGGVNALKGATFISTVFMALALLTWFGLCQCPEWGDLHFHSFIQKMVATPIVSVNALNGATFISTLASGNPHE